jgi:hypothetical protein
MTNGQTSTQEWVVRGDKLFPSPRAKVFWPVILNDTDTLVAFYRRWEPKGSKERRAFTLYVVISKSTGVLTELNDSTMNILGQTFETDRDIAAPDVIVGRCRRKRP